MSESAPQRGGAASGPFTVPGAPPGAAGDRDDGQIVAPFAALPDVLRGLGVDPNAVLASCGLAPDALANPGGRIPFPAAGALFDAAVAATGCEHLGLLVGQRFTLGRWGILGELTRSAATLGDALATMSVYQRLYSPGSLSFLDVDDTMAAIVSAIYHPRTLGIVYVHDLIAAVSCTALRELIAPGWQPREVLVARARPDDLRPYRTLFGVVPAFESEYTAVRFPAALLKRRLPTADAARFAALEAQAAGALRHNLVNDLRRALRMELIRGHTSAERVTRILAMHQRTLHRRLADDGTSFQAVLDDVRYDAARHYLELTAMPLVGIAAALGYSELSAFSRAFRRWSGAAPGAYRQQHRDTTAQDESAA